MLLVALAFVLVPLWRAGRQEAVSDVASNVAVFRARKKEIEQEFERGVLTESERDVALAELSARVVAEVPGSSASAPLPSTATGRPVGWAVGLSLFVVAVSAAFYYKFGNWQALHMRDLVAGSAAAAGADNPSEKEVLAMVDSLARKMEQNPGDPRGWVLLARSQAALGRISESLAAFERAIALSPGDAQLLADYADTQVMGQQGRFEGKPMDTIRQALKIDPANPKALALAGTGELRLGNRAASLKYWERLRALLEKDSDDYRQVESIIAEVSGVSETQAPAKGSARVTGQVWLDPALAAKISSSDVLFIYARAANGPRMPLAILKIAVPPKWPQSFELTDAMAMAPGMKLSAFADIVIEARISKSGNAQAQAGDLSGQTEVLKPGADNVKVTISRVLP